MAIKAFKQVIVDTNVLIYWFKNGINLRSDELDKICPMYSVITQIEALGFWDIKSYERLGIEALLEVGIIIDLNRKITERTINIRQQNHIKTPDAIIAATALEYGYELWTANTKDFLGIKNLKLHNPL